MSARACALAISIAVVAGCATPQQPEPEAVAEPEQPAVVVAQPPAPSEPQIAVAPPTPQPAPVVTPAPPAPPVRTSDTELLLQEFTRLRRLPAGELAREQEAARHAFLNTRTDTARVRYAMSLAVPGAPASDDVRALELLDPIARTPGATLHPLAFLLSSYVHEQRRLSAQVASLQQNVQGLQQNVNALQQKLDALKTLERSLSTRDSAPTRRR